MERDDRSLDNLEADVVAKKPEVVDGSLRSVAETEALSDGDDMCVQPIGKKGIKGRFYMKKGWDQSKAQVNRYFAQALDKIVEDLARGR